VSDVSDLIDALVGGGMSPDVASAMVARVVTLASRSVTVVTLSSRDASRSVTQEQSRLRAKNYRNRKKSQQVAKANDVATAGVIVTVPAVTRHATPIEQPLTNSLLLEGLSVEKEEKKESKKEVVTRARATRMPAGAPLTDEFISIAIELGASRAAIPKIWAEFVDYWCALPGTRGTKLDWPATWRNRLRQVVSKGQKNGRRTVHEAAKDLTEFLHALDEPAPSLCEREGAGALRLLPPGRRE
jgi:hypothetical protein